MVRSGDSAERDFRAAAVFVRKMLIQRKSEKPSSLFSRIHYHDLMLSLMPLYLFLACSVYAFCLLKLFLAAMEAPIGYEDRRGFHYGMETVSSDSVR